MRVLVACEFSGTVRDAFIAYGHDAMSCDLLPADIPGPHYQGDVRDVLGNGWDLMIAHPPCTYLSVSGLHWNKRIEGRAAKTEQALDFVRLLMDADIQRIAIENPVSCISTRIRKPDQIIQPYQFGHDASKATCLWLKGLPNLRPTNSVAPRIVNGRPRWANQCDSGQNKLAPSPDRWRLRSETYAGIARAMASQWGSLKEGDRWLSQNGCGLFSPATCNPANVAENLGAPSIGNISPNANASVPVTQKTKVIKLSNVMVEVAFGDAGEKER